MPNPTKHLATATHHQSMTSKSSDSSAPSLFTLSLLTAALFTANSVSASGLFLQEAVIANAGTTGAGDGVYTGSAAAMWANPATMSGMGESLTTVNALGLDIEMKYRDANGDASKNGNASTTMPSVGIFHARQLDEGLHLGFALGTVGGTSLDYGSNWGGANLMSDTSLTALQFNPSVSYQLNEQVSIGAGVQFNWASLEMGVLAGQVNIEQSSDWAYGYNLGVMYHATEKWDIGASFRSKVEHDFSTNLSGQLQLPVSTQLAVPAIADVSSSYALTDDLNLLASIQFHRWSEWDETSFGGNLAIDRDWDDVWKFAFATDYRLNEDWRLKAGFSYETSPQDDPTKQWVDLPVGEQYRYSIGASTQWEEYTFDVFYEYADLGSVEIDCAVNVQGTFDGRIHFIGVSMTF